MFLEPRYTAVIVRRVLSEERDQLGNEVWVDEEREVPVHGWSVPQSSEPKLDRKSTRLNSSHPK